MVPKLRTKHNTHVRVQRAPTRFSELDVTPSRPDEEHHASSKNDKKNLPVSQETTDDYYHDGDDVGDSLFDDAHDITNMASFAWSDGGSTNVTRRSTPAPQDDFPTQELWNFDDEDDETIERLLSQDPKNKNLPDTVPLKEPSLTPGPQPRVDFSETASTIRRSSPFLTSDVRKDIWDFSDSQSSSDSPSGETNSADKTDELFLSSDSKSQHIALDDIYDVTPKKDAAAAQVKLAVESKAKKSNIISVIHDHSTTAVMHPKLETLNQPSLRASAKNKRPHQKAKEPIQFDPVTQEIVDIPISKKKNPPPKQSIVSALQESAKQLSSPLVSTKRTSRKKAPKQKQPKAKPAKKRKLEAEAAQHDSPIVDILESSSVQIAQAEPAEISPDLRAVCHESEAMENEPTYIEVISDSKKKQNEGLHQTSLAMSKASDDLKPHPIEHAQPKRRKLSRQVSISEKGSPVVTRYAAPKKRARPTITEPDPLTMESTSPAVVAQRPSFLRTGSRDKLYVQQSDNTVGSSEDNLPSRWLRKLDEQQPRPAQNSSKERDIHDDIRKSFLQSAEPTQRLQDRRLDEMAGQSEVHKQICLTVKASSIQNRQLRDGES